MSCSKISDGAVRTILGGGVRVNSIVYPVVMMVSTHDGKWAER